MKQIFRRAGRGEVSDGAGESRSGRGSGAVMICRIPDCTLIALRGAANSGGRSPKPHHDIISANHASHRIDFPSPPIRTPPAIIADDVTLPVVVDRAEGAVFA